MKTFNDLADLTNEEISALLELAGRLDQHPEPRALQGKRILSVGRRAKYLLIRFDQGALILHLGMSGSLRVLSADAPLLKHDHVDLLLDDGRVLRFNDPRRFGSIHWQPHPVMEHWLLRALGPEPLSDALSGAYLKAAARRRKSTPASMR